MVVAVDGARSAPAAPGPAVPLTARRLLRRGLLVAAVATGGWLLSAMFTTATAAAEEPSLPVAETPASAPVGADTQADSTAGHESPPEPAAEPADTPTELSEAFAGLSGAIDDSMHQLTTTLAGITVGVADHTGAVLDPSGPAPALPIAELLPDLGLPGPGMPHDQPGAERAEPVPAPAPRAPPVTPASPVTNAVVAEHPPRSVVAVTTPQRTIGGVPEHATETGSDQQPGEAPAPAAPAGIAGAIALDHSGGARGTLGVLTAQATARPSAAGFTTRGRAADASGRVAGLPATSPD